MKIDIDLVAVLKALGWPVGLIAFFSAVLGLLGIDLNVILSIAGGLVGTFALISLLINILKWVGVITDGTAGYWSAGANLLVVLGVTVVFKLYPTFDFASADAALGEFARVAGIVFAYIIQLVGTKQIHVLMTRGLKIKAFSYQLLYYSA